MATACAPEPGVDLPSMRHAAAASSASVWDAAMASEAAFNEEKRLKNKVQSLREGTLLPGEARDCEVQLEAAIRAHNATLRDGRLRTAARKRAALQQARVQIGAGARVLIHSAGDVLRTRSPFEKYGCCA